MSKRRNNNSIQKFFRKPIVMMTCVALVVVLVFGALGTITNGFSDWSGETMKDGLSTLHINQKNLFYDVIEDGEIADSSNVEAEAKNGIITLSADIADTDENAVTPAENIAITTLKLSKGTYTLTAYDDADWKTCYVVGTYNLNGTTHTWYADYKTVPSKLASETAHARTLELTEDVEVTFSIRVCEGAELEDVKIAPVLVEGEDEGNYYAGFLGAIMG